MTQPRNLCTRLVDGHCNFRCRYKILPVFFCYFAPLSKAVDNPTPGYRLLPRADWSFLFCTTDLSAYAHYIRGLYQEDEANSEWTEEFLKGLVKSTYLPTVDRGMRDHVGNKFKTIVGLCRQPFSGSDPFNVHKSCYASTVD